VEPVSVTKAGHFDHEKPELQVTNKCCQDKIKSTTLIQTYRNKI